MKTATTNHREKDHMARFSNITLRDDGGFEGIEHDFTADIDVRFSGIFPLFLIREAWGQGVSFEDLADGFGEGMGTMGGDWSGIRDSSHHATEAMFERALNHFFAEAKEEELVGYGDEIPVR